MKRFYIDEWGRLWFRWDELTVYNDEVGFGGWFNGNGLKPAPTVESGGEK